VKTILANRHLDKQQYAQLAENETNCYENVIGLFSDSFNESENENGSKNG
jgi:hypothetical protein